MWKPDWLYELMPLIYTAAGMAAFMKFDTWLGYGSGVLLLLAAFIIWKLRKEHRALKRMA